MPQPNQHLPIPPAETLRVHIFHYWQLKKNDIQITALLLKKHIDRRVYGLSYNSFRKIRAELGFLRARQQNHDLESITPAMLALRKKYPTVGAREATSILFFDFDMCVPRDLVVQYFSITEPELVRLRKHNRLRRRRFWAAGVNDLLSVDQHDKFKKFGLALHTGIDPFSGRIHWIRVWWGNNNPRLILSYYLDFIEHQRYVPLATQSDLGSENYGIANAHTALRHLHDPNLVGTIQHRWMRTKKNVKPEIIWSQLRRRFTPGFETLFDRGVVEGWYDISRPIDMLVFRWLMIPWLQQEVNQWVYRYNHTPKRADKNSILPRGAPQDIHESPERWGCLDFRIELEVEHLDTVRNQYIPPNDPTFDLVPEAFGRVAEVHYSDMGRPLMSIDSAWDIYRQLVARFENMHTIANDIEEYQIALDLMTDSGDMEAPHGAELFGGDEVVASDGYFYMGGVNNGRGLDLSQEKMLDEMDEAEKEFEMMEMAEFTDDEDDGEGDGEGDGNRDLQYDQW